MLASVLITVFANASEPELGLTYYDYRLSVSRYLGYGAEPAKWKTEQAAHIEEDVRSGYRQFLIVYKWSFLRPVQTLATVSGTGDYDLPAGVHSIDGELSFAADQAVGPIVTRPEHQIRDWRATNNRTGKPRFAAIRPKGGTGAAGQTYELMLFPTPDSVYTLTYRYHAFSPRLGPGAPYALAGAEHHETIKAACLAAAELSRDDVAGQQDRKYQRLLADSIRVDQRTTTPETLGVMRDATSSLLSEGETWERLRAGESVKYDGVQY